MSEWLDKYLLCDAIYCHTNNNWNFSVFQQDGVFYFGLLRQTTGFLLPPKNKKALILLLNQSFY